MWLFLNRTDEKTTYYGIQRCGSMYTNTWCIIRSSWTPLHWKFLNKEIIYILCAKLTFWVNICNVKWLLTYLLTKNKTMIYWCIIRSLCTKFQWKFLNQEIIYILCTKLTFWVNRCNVKWLLTYLLTKNKTKISFANPAYSRLCC